MGFFLFILVNAALFVRPHELLGFWQEAKVYEPLILACLAASILELTTLVCSGALFRQPLTLLVFGLLPIIFVSNLQNVGLDSSRPNSALEVSFEFAKVILYYLLLITHVNSPRRLQQFLFWITVFIACISLLAVLRYHGVITLEILDAMKDVRGDGYTREQVFVRLRGTGLFDDPNDFATLLVVGVLFCTYWLIDGTRFPPLRLLWVGVLVLFLYTLMLTQSRGVIVALMVGLLALIYNRFGPKQALGLVVLLMPLVLMVFAARQTSFESQGANLSRFQQWLESFGLLKQSPLIGVGMNQFSEHSYLVAHNGFMHCYGELGLLGGTLFFGLFFFAITFLARLGSRNVLILDPLARRLNPYILAAVVGYAAALMTLSRSYVILTYLVLGVAAAQTQMARTLPARAWIGQNPRLVRRLAFASVGFLAIMLVTCLLLVRYS